MQMPKTLIMESICTDFPGTTPADIASTSKRFALQRHILWYFLAQSKPGNVKKNNRYKNKPGLREIGKFQDYQFDHKTVSAGIQSVIDFASVSPDFKARLEQIQHRLIHHQ